MYVAEIGDPFQIAGREALLERRFVKDAAGRQESFVVGSEIRGARRGFDHDGDPLFEPCVEVDLDLKKIGVV